MQVVLPDIENRRLHFYVAHRIRIAGGVFDSDWRGLPRG
jgi:hypothetical protein